MAIVEAEMCVCVCLSVLFREAKHFETVVPKFPNIPESTLNNIGLTAVLDALLGRQGLVLMSYDPPIDRRLKIRPYDKTFKHYFASFWQRGGTRTGVPRKYMMDK